MPYEALEFPISRDPPEGGTGSATLSSHAKFRFQISRDPPEGGTYTVWVGPDGREFSVSNF